MIRFVPASMVLLSGVHPVAAQQTGRVGHHVGNQTEEIIFGHLVELNGKFKSRATEVTFAPDAYRKCFTEGGLVRRSIRTGEYFFETGNLLHTAQNQTNLPLRILFFEILPKDWS